MRTGQRTLSGDGLVPDKSRQYLLSVAGIGALATRSLLGLARQRQTGAANLV